MITHRLRHRVDVQSRVTIQDPTTGTMVVSWVDFIKGVPAEVLTGHGGERFTSGAVHADTDARIMMRWFPGLEPTMRILWDGRQYNILSIATDATGRIDYRLQCQEGLTDGE